MGEIEESIAGRQASPADRSSKPKRRSERPVRNVVVWATRLLAWFAVGYVVRLTVVIVIAVAAVITYIIIAAADTRPSLIDDLRAGRVTSRDVTSAAILKFDPGAGWPGSEETYAAKARHQLKPDEWSTLIGLLAEATTDGCSPETTRRASTTASC